MWATLRGGSSGSFTGGCRDEEGCARHDAPARPARRVDHSRARRRPRARSLYVRAAVEYEAVHLIGELRRIQAVSRTTAMPLYMIGGTAAGAREPQIYVRGGSYEIAPHGGAGRAHRMLPLVRITQVTADGKPMSFDRNGGIGQGSSNMTIRIEAEGHARDALNVIIDSAARIRLQRGGRDEE